MSGGLSANPHGGPDALGLPAHDFSTNANGCGPCPPALAAVQAADAQHYPDPAYTALRQRLADWHGVAPSRLLLAASASEFIGRISSWVALRGGRAVAVPRQAYGDYAQAARARGLAVVVADAADAADTADTADTAAWASAPQADLAWAADPMSPTGQRDAMLAARLADWAPQRPLVLDCAYAPLRLAGPPALDAAAQQRVWQLWTPNKALGLTGLRGAYAIAPLQATAHDLDALTALAPSWPLGGHAQALLWAWTEPATQAWLAESRATLTEWMAAQRALCAGLGWQLLPSDANFFCARPPDAAALPGQLARLRALGIKLRDCASFGLPGHVRLRALPPASQRVLAQAWTALCGGVPTRPAPPRAFGDDVRDGSHA